MRRRANFTLACGKGSVDSLSELLFVVRQLLQLFRRPDRWRQESSTLDGDIGLDVWSANVEHLLLCLDAQLLRALIVRVLAVVVKQADDWQRAKNTRRRNDLFFFEFPDARHPLSTTWPWSIRPALAVLWGVCWMFYESSDRLSKWRIDGQGNLVNEYGSILALREELERDFSDFTTTAQTAQRTAQPLPRLPSPLAQPQRSVSEFQAASLLSASADTMALSPASAVSSGGESRMQCPRRERGRVCLPSPVLTVASRSAFRARTVSGLAETCK